MDRAGSIVAWSSIATVGAGIAFAGFLTYQLESGRWVATPPPRGFGMGGPNDGMTACLADARSFCPNDIELARIACILANRSRLSPGCQAALTGGN